MKLNMGIIHIEKQEIREPKRTTADGWHRTITPEERAELWNDGKGRDYPDVIEGEYEEVKECRALPGS